MLLNNPYVFFLISKSPEDSIILGETQATARVFPEFGNQTLATDKFFQQP